MLKCFIGIVGIVLEYAAVILLVWYMLENGKEK
jgi:hypothetical protein